MNSRSPLSRPPAGGVLSQPYRSITLGMAALISLGAFEALAVATAMPTVARELDGLRLYALAFGGTLAAGVVGMTLSGRLSDARGPAFALWQGVSWFVAGLLLAGFAPAMWALLIGRVVQGFGSGMMIVAIYVVVGRVYPKELRPRVFASFSAAWVVPSIVGPTISGLIVEYAGWRWVFLAVPLLAVPAALMLRPGLRTLPPPATSLADMIAPPPADETAAPPAGADAAPADNRVGWALGASLSACLLHYGGQQRGTAAFALIAAALAGLVTFATRLLPAGTLRARRGLPAVIVLRGIAGAAFFGTEAFVPLMLSREHGLTPAWAGLALTLGALGWSAGSQYQGSGRWPWSRPRLIQLGTSLMVVGIVVIVAAISPSAPAAITMAGWLLTGLGMGLVYPSLSVLTLELSPPGQQGASSSALQLCDSLSIATALALGGSLFAALLPVSPRAAYSACFGLSAALAALGLAVAGRTRAEARAA